MLALLAKMKQSGTTPSLEGSSMAEDIPETDPTEDWLRLSTKVDQHLATLNSLTLGGATPSADDNAIVLSLIEEYATEINKLDASVDELQKACTEGARQTEELLFRIQNWGQEHPQTPIQTTIGSPVNIDTARRASFATPLRRPSGTPKSAGKVQGIDFDAFPQTPTLEQLGLSKATLDVVGYRKRGFPLLS